LCCSSVVLQVEYALRFIYLHTSRLVLRFSYCTVQLFSSWTCMP
jgi:hypothetical protein